MWKPDESDDSYQLEVTSDFVSKNQSFSVEFSFFTNQRSLWDLSENRENFFFLKIVNFGLYTPQTPEAKLSMFKVLLV